MSKPKSASTAKAPSMQRLSLQLVTPGMTIARDIYDFDGTTMLSAGTVLTERMIVRLRQREILSVFIRNPQICLPDISEADREVTRNKARLVVEHAFNLIRRAERFSMSSEEQQIVHKVVEEVTQDPAAIVHIAHLQRNSRDIMTHSVNVSLLATATALALGVSKGAVLHELALAALLHDIGLLMIPQDLIARRDHLKPEEILIYREHTNWGQAILQQASDLPPSIALVAQEHHEHADGTGYPNQLTSSSLHPFSRIINVVNFYENFCAVAVEHGTFQAHLAYEAVTAGAGARFDLNVAKALLSRLPMYPPGSLVKLTNGSVGVVLSSSRELPHRPKLNILATSEGKRLPNPMVLDLVDLENQTLFVKEVLDDTEAEHFTK